MRYCVTRQQAGRAIQVLVEGKRNNWIARSDQGEIPREVGQRFNIPRVGDQIILRRGDKYYTTCLRAAPDLNDDHQRLIQVATNLAGAIMASINGACDSFKANGGLKISRPQDVIRSELIRQLRQ